MHEVTSRAYARDFSSPDPSLVQAPVCVRPQVVEVHSDDVHVDSFNTEGG